MQDPDVASPSGAEKEDVRVEQASKGAVVLPISQASAHAQKAAIGSASQPDHLQATIPESGTINEKAPQCPEKAPIIDQPIYYSLPLPTTVSQSNSASTLSSPPYPCAYIVGAKGEM